MPYPEHARPPQTCEVSFDAKLLEMVLEQELDERERIDAFWTELYWAHLPIAAREYVMQADATLVDFQILPLDHTEDQRQVSLLLRAHWSYPDESGVHDIYSPALTFDMAGTYTVGDDSTSFHYPPDMQSHIEDVFVMTVVEYEAADTFVYTGNNE